MNSDQPPASIHLQLDTIGWSIDSTQILKEISLYVHPGEMVGLLGPNGSGKSSLLRCIYRYLLPTTGVIFVNGVNLMEMSLQESAKQVAAVLQERTPEFHIKVFETVLMGRTPHKKRFEGDSTDDYSIAARALDDVNLTEYADRLLHTLSGGEIQRVYLARALCQRAQLLILDEPTNHLDIAHQLSIMKKIKALSLSTITALHDLNIAAAFCDRICVLHRGEIVAIGTPENILSEELIYEVYGVRAQVQKLPKTGQLSISYLINEPVGIAG